MKQKTEQGEKVIKFNISKIFCALTTAIEKSDADFFDEQEAEVKCENYCCCVKAQNRVGQMKKFMSNGWVLGIGTTVIGGLIHGWIKDGNCLSAFKEIISFAVKAGLSILNFELRVWWVLVAVALIVAALLAAVKCSTERATQETPPFLHYTRDFLLGYAWEWSYKKTYEGKYTISDFHPVCAKCGMRLKQGGAYGQEMSCLRCNKKQPWKDSLLTDAQMLIEDNIRRNHQQNQ